MTSTSHSSKIFLHAHRLQNYKVTYDYSGGEDHDFIYSFLTVTNDTLMNTICLIMSQISKGVMRLMTYYHSSKYTSAIQARKNEREWEFKAINYCIQ